MLQNFITYKRTAVGIIQDRKSGRERETERKRELEKER